MEKSVCFTGHRPNKLSQNGITETTVRQRLQKEVARAIDEGYTFFYTGMAMGSDLIAGEVVLAEKQKNPAIKLCAVVPYLKQPSRWDAKWKLRYQNMILNCDTVYYLHTEYCRGCYMERNRFMVEHSSLVIAVYNGAPGGTRNTIEFAKKLEKEVRIIPC